MSRISPKPAVLRKLFAHSGNQCAFPGCSEPLIDGEDFIGQVCHIEAANEGGERYNPNQTDEERRSFENLLILCYKHHIKTNNVLEFPVDRLQQIKSLHESKFKGSDQYSLPDQLEAKVFSIIGNQLDLLLDKVSNNQIGIDKNQAGIEKLLNMVGGLVNVTTANISDSASMIYSEYLSDIIELRNKGKSKSALDLLVKFKNKNWNTIEPELKYKTIVNQAGILLDLQETKESAECLLELNSIEYKSENLTANLCLAYSILDDFVEFNKLVESTSIDSTLNVTFWSAFIRINKNRKTRNEIIEAIPIAINTEPELLINIGGLFTGADDQDQLLEYMDKAYEKLPADISKKWLLQSWIANLILSFLGTMEKIHLGSFQPGELNRIKSCARLLEEVYEYLHETDLKSHLAEILFNLGICNKILGDDDKAKDNFRAAWTTHKLYTYYQALVFHLTDIGELPEIDSLLDQQQCIVFKNNSERIDFDVLYAGHLSKQSRYSEACDVLIKRLQFSVGRDRLRMLDLISLTLFQAGKFEDASCYVDEMVKEYPHHPEGYLNQLEIEGERRSPDKVKITAYLNEILILAGADSSTSYRTWYVLGVKCLKYHRYTEAIECLEKIYVPGVTNEVTRMLAKVYYFAGRYDDALMLYSKLGNQTDPTINDVIFKIHENSGNFDKADDVLKFNLSVQQNYTRDYFFKVAIGFYKSIGYEKRLRELLLSFRCSDNFSLIDRFRYAGVLFDLGEIDAGLRLSYDTRLDFFEEKEAHEAYFQTLTFGNNRGQTEVEMFPEIVNMECGVKVINSTQEESLYFLTEDYRSAGEHILRSQDPLAIALIGRKLGETISLPNSIGPGAVLTVLEITNQYIYAFRESLKILELKHSGNTKLVVFRTDEKNDIGQIKDFIKENAKSANKDYEEIVDFYKLNPVPLGMLQLRLNLNYIEIWLDVVSVADIPFISLEANENPTVQKIFISQPKIIIELSALLTMFCLLDIEKHLLQVNAEFYVSRKTFSELLSYLDLLRNNRTPAITYSYQNGNLYKYADDGSRKENLIKSVSKIINWCKENTKITGPKWNKNGEKDIQSITDILGIDSVQLAYELDGILMSDDERLKGYSLGEFQIEAFGTHGLLSGLFECKSLEEEEYYNMVYELIRYNYVYIPVNEKMLWSLLEESSFSIKRPFTNSLNGLLPLGKNDLIKTFIKFAKELYLRLPVKEQTDLILMAVLGQMKRRNDYTSIKQILPNQVKKEFKHLPFQEKSLQDLIRNF